MMMDVAPHFAMQGQNIRAGVEYRGFVGEGLGLNRHRAASGRRRREDQGLPEPIARFLDPLSLADRETPDRHSLSSFGEPLSFEIPVMLNPGELLLTNSRNNSFMGDRDVHLHINAQVHMPGTVFIT